MRSGIETEPLLQRSSLFIRAILVLLTASSVAMSQDIQNSATTAGGRYWSGQYFMRNNYTRGYSVGTSRMSLAGEYAYRSLRRDDTHTLDHALTAVGPVQIALGAGLSMEYNDNINLSATDPIGDLIAHPRVMMDLAWQITRTNNLTVRLDVGYDYYFGHVESRRSAIFLNPDTVIEFNIFFGDFRLQIYDKPIIQNDPSGDPTVSDVVNFNIFQNALGASLLWDGNDILLNVGVQRQDSISFDSEFNDNDSYGYMVYAAAFLRPDPLYQIGTRLSSTYTIYTAGGRGDTRSSLAGLIFQANLSPYTSIYAEGGLQFIEVSASSNGFHDGYNKVQPYYEVTIDNRLNRYITQYLAVSKISAPTFGSELDDSLNIYYGINYQYNKRISFGIFGGCLLGSDVGSGGQEYDYTRFEVGLRVNYQWLKDWNWFVDYRHLNQVSSNANTAYTQNRISIGFQMMF